VMPTEDVHRNGSPSGEQYAIASGGWSAQVTQFGATLRTCTLNGLEVIDGFGLNERATDGRGQVLAPWPNRLTGGRYRYAGRDCQAPINDTKRQTAIHGLVRWLDWSVIAHHPSSVTLSCTVRPQPGYEWQLGVDVTYQLDDAGLTVTCQAANAGAERAPFGVGFHPYLTLGTPSIDGLELTLPATSYLQTGAPDGTPAMASVASTPLDFAEPRRIGSVRLDTCFGGLLPEGDQRLAVVRLTDSDAGRSIHLWADDTFRYLMVYTGDEVGRSERRRTAIAIEPMTCPPDAFRTGTDLIELEPGESWRGTWGFRAESALAS
jgi:aldose 1-epimerase